MKTLALLVVLLAFAPATINAQDLAVYEGTLIESAEVSGLPFDQLSPGLRQDITALTGQRVNSELVGELARRLEAERPDVVTAVRGVSRPDGRTRLIFLIARISDDRTLLLDINARYVVEAVEITGIPESKVSQALRDDLQALTGRRLDPDEAERLEERLEKELPNFEVRRNVSRGTQSAQIKLTFEVSEVPPPPWIPFTPSRSQFVYHGDLGGSGMLDIQMGGKHHRVTLGLAFGNDDDLIEEYSGYGLRFESRKVGTERLGFRIEWNRFRQSWREITLAAIESDSRIPEAYRSRLMIEPAVTFAITRRLRITGGISISELESQFRAPESVMANAAIAAIDYRHSAFDAGYELRSGTTALESELDYKRHFGKLRYRHKEGDNEIDATFAVGRVSGRAPLFERFSLGDTSTLRGWSKFDIALAGGNRMFHHSLEYRFHGFALFLDGGAVWNQGSERRLRYSTGVGFHEDNVFFTLGVPLNADEASATFMMGVRF